MAQRQFRSDDTAAWIEKYGLGTNGDKVISSNVDSSNYSNYVNVTAGTAADVSLTLGSSGNPGYHSADQPVFIHQSRSTGVGIWELNVISASNGFDSGGGAITMKYPLMNSYTTFAQMWNLAQFTSFTVNNGFTLSAPAWNGTTGGHVPRVCSGTVSVAGGISVSSLGFRGGTSSDSNQAYSGEGTAGYENTGQPNGNGGGAGANFQGGSGGGGGNANAGGNGSGGSNPGTGGLSVGAAALTTMIFGGGGGATTRGGSQGPGAFGGAGGGLILIIAKNIVVTGSLTGGATAGGAGGQTGAGGGAGGSILLKAQTATLGTGLITASGASGGSGSETTGGTGSTGRIHLDYSNSLSGTTTPTLDSTLDRTLGNQNFGSLL